MMKILVLGGTRFFGIPMVEELLRNGNDVTIATRGLSKDSFGERVHRMIINRNDPQSLKEALGGQFFDVVYDKIAYCSNDIKYLLDILKCGRYIYMSTAAVYEQKHLGLLENEFDASTAEYKMCNREDYSYDVVKRYAEAILFRKYSGINALAVRYPVVLGETDYTNRLKFYVEHTLNGMPMHIDNPDVQMCFIFADEAGKFLAHLADKNILGTVNGCNKGTVSIKEILDYIYVKTGKQAIIAENGDTAPYNGEFEYSLNTDKAKSVGYEFSEIKDRIYKLIDYYIDEITIGR